MRSFHEFTGESETSVLYIICVYPGMSLASRYVSAGNHLHHPPEPVDTAQESGSNHSMWACTPCKVDLYLYIGAFQRTLTQ